jgi:hypothetical protein
MIENITQDVLAIPNLFFVNGVPVEPVSSQETSSRPLIAGFDDTPQTGQPSSTDQGLPADSVGTALRSHEISRKSQARLHVSPCDIPLHWPCRHTAIEESGRPIMTKIILVLALSAATLASVPLSAAEQGKDRCVLKEDSAEKIADCDKVLKKNASPLDELARRNRGLLPER